MTIYVGLTNNPQRRWEEHGKPRDFKHKQFRTEQEARRWERHYTRLPGMAGNTGGRGWKYGYWYTVTRSTIE